MTTMTTATTERYMPLNDYVKLSEATLLTVQREIEHASFPVEICTHLNVRAESIRLDVDIVGGTRNVISLIADTMYGRQGTDCSLFLPRAEVTFPSVHLRGEKLATFAAILQKFAAAAKEVEKVTDLVII